MKTSASAACSSRLDDDVSTTDVAPISARRDRHRGHRVADDDLRCPGSEGDKGDCGTDRPGAGDCDAGSDSHLRLAASPQPDRQWLAKGARVIADLVGQSERIVLVDGHIAGERAVDRRRRKEDHITAQVVMARAALPAGAAWHARLERDPLAELVAFDQVPLADDDPGGLVAEHHG